VSVPATPNHDQPVRELFRHRATRDGRAVVALRGMLMADGSATVEAEVHPPDAASQGAVLRRPYRFPSAEVALAFADEAVLCLEYLNCDVG